MRREYPEAPLVSATAIVVHEGKVLAIRRANEPSKGKWSFPGGLVELGERVKDAVKREVKEEVGLDVEVMRYLGVVDNIIKDGSGRTKYHYVILGYLASPLSLEVEANEEVLEWMWMSKDELMSSDSTRTAKILISSIDLFT